MGIKDVFEVGAAKLSGGLEVGSGGEGTAKTASEFPCLDN